MGEKAEKYGGDNIVDNASSTPDSIRFAAFSQTRLPGDVQIIEVPRDNFTLLQ